MTYSENLSEISSDILKKINFDAEVYIIRSKSLKINILNQKIESIDKGDIFGISLRIVKDKRVGFSFSSGGKIDLLIKEAIENVGFMERDEFNVLPHFISEPNKMDIYDEEINKISINHKIEIAKEIEANAYEYDPKVTKTESAGYFESEHDVHIANSYGINFMYRANYCGGFAQVICEDKKTSETIMEEGFSLEAAKKWKDFNYKEIGHDAAKKALELLGGKIIKSQNMPVVFDPFVAAQFLQIISHALSSEEVQKGKSFLSSKLETKVANNNVNIIDDGFLLNGLNSVPFDDEGILSKKNILIKEGILSGYLNNSYTAQKDKIAPTGNARRPSFKSLPGIGATNFYLMRGDANPDEIIKKISNGIFITRVMAMHSVNTVSGDFSVGAQGLMIENGEKTYPVRGITIAGNMLEMLESIDEIGNDLRFHPAADNCGSPTLLINNLSISGE